MDRLTVEEARIVELPLNPISRMIECARLGESFHLQHVGMSPMSATALTKHGLVKLAEHQEAAQNMLAIADEIHNRSIEEGEN